jgi:acetyl esterase/lipase
MRVREDKACLYVLLALAQSLPIARGADLKPVISEKLSPLEVIVATDRDGREIPAVMRRPPGRKGDLPAMVFFHGGLDQMPLDGLKKGVVGPLHTLFLAEGYIVVNSTYRGRADDPQRPETVQSAVAMIDAVKKIPGVDSKSVVVVGSSGGGTLALEVASATDLAAIGPFEPATIIFMGMLSKANRVASVIMQDPERFWTPEIRQKTRERLGRLTCPVFLGHGDINALKKVNFEIFVPELLKSGKPVELHVYPGMQHSSFGFYYPKRMEYVKRFFDDCNNMFKKFLNTQPVRVGSTAIEWVKDIPPSEPVGLRTFADLRGQQPVRAEDPPAPAETPVGSFRTGPLRLRIYLPIGSEPGQYEVQILGGAGESIVRLAGRMSADEDQNPILELLPDVTKVTPGRYLLAVRKAKSQWQYYPLIVRKYP